MYKCMHNFYKILEEGEQTYVRDIGLVGRIWTGPLSALRLGTASSQVPVGKVAFTPPPPAGDLALCRATLVPQAWLATAATPRHAKSQNPWQRCGQMALGNSKEGPVA